MLPEWGVESQQKLKQSRVFVAGVGGLGCPVVLNLAQAGIGRVRICDCDKVETTNLNRQFLHSEEKIGMNKVESAVKGLCAVNPDTTLEPVFEKITDRNVNDVVGDAQVIIDCLDNFVGRYALNQCAIQKGIPMVHGAVWGFEGRITFFHPPETPCLMCLFPKAPSEERPPAVGPVTCAVGSLQAIEAIKYLTGSGRLLTGRMLILDTSTMRCQELQVARNPECPACGGREMLDA